MFFPAIGVLSNVCGHLIGNTENLILGDYLENPKSKGKPNLCNIV